MIGLLELSEGIFCKKEVLGKSFEIMISDIKAYLIFPNYLNKKYDFYSSHSLLPPNIFVNTKLKTDEIFWGHIMQAPSGNSIVNNLAILGDYEENEYFDIAKKIYDSIETWEHAFIDYLKIKTKQGTEIDYNSKRASCGLVLFDDNNYSINNSININIKLAFPDMNVYASEDDIKKAISFANSKKELALEYQMLLSSYNAIRINRKRQALLDACAAIEISLVKQIEKYCELITLDPTILLDKYRYLGDRFDLVKKIKKDFPNENYRKLIVTPRNEVFHNKKVNPSNKTILDLISCVEKFLEYFNEAYY